jgi:hypothetical protein
MQTVIDDERDLRRQVIGVARDRIAQARVRRVQHAVGEVQRIREINPERLKSRHGRGSCNPPG